MTDQTIIFSKCHPDFLVLSSICLPEHFFFFFFFLVCVWFAIFCPAFFDFLSVWVGGDSGFRIYIGL